MSALKAAMPVLAQHEGVWEGWYRTYDKNGDKMDEHQSRLICRFPTNGPIPYHQTNHYTWADGRTETREFPGEFRDGRLWFISDLIDGWAADVPLDPHSRTVMLHWKRKGEPETYLYEMIQISDCGKYRSRAWQWIREGRVAMRTLIDEHRISETWVDC